MKFRQALRWMAARAVFTEDDLLIVGLPKTATTWLKSVVVSALHGPALSHDDVNAMCTEYGASFRTLRETTSPRIIKTHKPRNPLHLSHTRILGLRRDIEDNVLSYYAYCAAKDERILNGGFLRFCKDTSVVDWFFKFYETWEGRASKWICYEDIISQRFDLIAPRLAEVLSVKEEQAYRALLENDLASSRQKAALASQQKGKFARDFQFVGASKFKQDVRASISDCELDQLRELINKRGGRAGDI